MSNYKIKVNIEIVECEEPESKTPIRREDGSFEFNISSAVAESIDDCEQSLLETNYPALRIALSEHLESVSKKKLLALAPEQVIIAKPSAYRVDGEVGRFSFQVHELAEPDHSEANTILNQMFPPQPGKTWYRTRGFKELAYVHGTPEESYRKASAWLNRVRHQANATSSRTLQDNTESEGQRIMQHLRHKSEEILKEHQFDSEGKPQNPRKRYRTRKIKTLSAEISDKALQSNQIPEDLRPKMKANPVPYENPIQSVNITVDDVGVKEQKEKRHLEEEAVVEKKESHHTYQTVVHIENPSGSYAFNTLGTVAAMPILIAFLLHNQLFSRNLLFFVDGQKNLRASILNAFSWFGAHQLLLDWYHLEEKCKKQLSLALNGRQIRNEILTHVLYWLWHGLVDEAIEYLDTVKSEHIKNREELDKLKGYFLRNKPYIPCYSVRKILRLRNSSNQGEKCNDLLVAERQKHNGMSWSKLGSVALAAVTALVRNQESTTWFKTRDMKFKLVPSNQN